VQSCDAVAAFQCDWQDLHCADDGLAVHPDQLRKCSCARQFTRTRAFLFISGCERWVRQTVTVIIRVDPVDVKNRLRNINAHGWNFNQYLPASTLPDELPKTLTQYWMQTRHGEQRMEWGYLQVQPRLFVECALVAAPADTVIDLSIHAVNGLVIIIEIETAAKTYASQKGYFHPDGSRWRAIERADERPGETLLPEEFKTPGCIQKAISAAAAVGAGVDYARFDFLVAGEEIYAGETTVHPGAGLNHAATLAS